MSTTVQIILSMAALYSVFFVFYYFQRKKRKETLANYNTDSEYANSKTIIANLMNSPHFSAIKEQMAEKPVDAITECAYISNFGKQAAGFLGTAAKTVAWAAVGVKARYRETDNAAYLILSNEELHYLLFVEGQVKEHLIFDRNRMMNAVLSDISAKDNITRFTKIAGQKARKLSFDIDGKPLSILFYNRISRSPGGGDVHMFNAISTETNKRFVDYEIMGKYFAEQLPIKFPALNMNNTIS